MDYEKKYKEALERAKGVIEQNPLMEYLKKGIEYIFPDLKESEDDRIRKEIIEYFENCNIKHLDWITWLEKQGEVDVTNNEYKVTTGLYKCVHRMFDGTPDGKLLFEVGNIYKCLSKHDRAEFEVSYGHSIYLEDPVVCKHFIPFEKQDEQKLANKVKPKFKVGDKIIKFSKTPCPVHASTDDTICEVVEVQDTCYILNTKEGKIQEPFEWQDYYELVEPKTAWSEEDERIIKRIDSLLYSINESDFEDIRAWLKSLRPQPKQEWGEEDKRILDALITSLINERFAGRLEFLKGIKVSSVIDWLKSLKDKIKGE